MLLLHYDEILSNPKAVLDKLLALFNQRLTPHEYESVLKQWNKLIVVSNNKNTHSECELREEIEAAVRQRCEASNACRFAGFEKYAINQ